MNHPNLYLLRIKENKFEIYFGEFSTLDGIKLLDKDLKINITEFGATNYKNFGFANEEDIPKIETVEELVNFLENVDFIDIIHCKIEVLGIGELSTHDDGECHFILNSKEIAYQLIQNASEELHKDKILSELLKHPNNYIKIDINGNIQRYFTFDDYIKNHLK